MFKIGNIVIENNVVLAPMAMAYSIGLLTPLS